MDAVTDEIVEIDPEFVLPSKRIKCCQQTQPNDCDMDLKKQRSVSSPSQENSTRNLTTTVGVSPTAKLGVSSSQCSENLKDDDMISFSNPRKPDCCLKISRKEYQVLVQGRQLSYTLASQQEWLSVRMLVAPHKVNSSGDLSNEKEFILTRGEKEGEAVLEDTTSTISSEYSNNINSSVECEEQSINMGLSNTEIVEEEVGSNFPDSHVKQLSFPFFFKASSKSKGRLIKMAKSRFRYFRTRGRRSLSSVSSPSSSITKIYGKSLKSKYVYSCRNQESGCKGRKRKINNEELRENCFTKRRFKVNHDPVCAIQVEEECCNEVSFTSVRSLVSRVSLGVQGGP